MLEVQKEALANRTRQRLVALREKELDYYTANCRMLGNQSALVSGFAYSAIRYHNWMEQQVPCCVSAVRAELASRHAAERLQVATSV